MGCGVRVVTVVSGLPRSGTSLVMQMLEAGGMAVFVDDERPPDPGNPRGYYERAAVKRLLRDPSCLDGAAGKAVKVIHRLLPALPLGADGAMRYRVIVCRRSIEEVLSSQRALLDLRGRPGARLDPALLGRTLQAQLARAERWLETQPAVRWIAVEHADLLRDPVAEAERIASFLGDDLDVSAMAAVVDPALYRQRQALGAK